MGHVLNALYLALPGSIMIAYSQLLHHNRIETLILKFTASGKGSSDKLLLDKITRIGSGKFYAVRG